MKTWFFTYPAWMVVGLAMALCVLGAAGDATAATSHGDPLNKPTLLLSAPATESWGRLEALVQKNKGYVTKQDVETALAIRFTRSWHDPERERGSAHPLVNLTHEFKQSPQEAGLER